MYFPSSAWSTSDTSNDLRDSLVSFWLNSPIDQLQFYWSSPIGTLTAGYVKSLHSEYVFTPDQISLRNRIGSFFSENGLSHPLSAQLMLANFLLSPPGLLKINNIQDYFPDWLCSIYNDLYSVDSEAKQIDPVQQSNQSGASSIPTPDFGPFPSSLSDLVVDRVHLNRLLGLSNLYYIDPEDEEIKSELIALRTSLSNLINSAPESDLERLWSTDFGDRYWSLVRSGIQKEDLNSYDADVKDLAVKKLNPATGGGFGTPNSLNAFLVAMMYFLPGTMSVDNPEQKLPSWLLQPFNEIFGVKP